jgi:glycosyltransferase involved in cell wall biosynthesis
MPKVAKGFGHVLFVGFWGAADPLTTASFLPTIQRFKFWRPGLRSTLATVERDRAKLEGVGIPDGVVHVALRASRIPWAALARAVDMLFMPLKLAFLARRQGVDLIVARTTLAGGIAYFVNRLTGIPYMVESVEPHTEYMVECGAWTKGGVFALAGHWMETRVLRSASGIITVSQRYADRLVREGHPARRVRTVPCPVPFERFAFDAVPRARARERLGVGANELLGIYLGKFGGLYHDEHAYRAFAAFLQQLDGRGRMLVLTPTDPVLVHQGMLRHGIARSSVHVDHVSHDRVPEFLHAADVAFALYKGTPSSAYLSPIKNGEYWASGLPVLMTRGVGDDSDIIEEDEVGGALFDPEGDDIHLAIRSVLDVLARPDQRQRTMELGRRARGEEHLDAAYFDLLTTLFGPDAMDPHVPKP